MARKSDKTSESRRSFLKLASVSAPAAVAAVSLGQKPAEAATISDSGEPRLADTGHARAYYDSARF